MRNLLLFSIVFILGECALADLCTECNAEVLSTDAFCASCGYDVSAWRKRLVSQRPKTQQDDQRPPVQKAPSRSSARPDISDYVYTGATMHYMTPSDTITPIKLTVVDKIALPWERNSVVYGLHLAALGGSCHTIYGLNIAGIGNNCHTMGGLGFAIFNQVHEFYGAQLGFVNLVDELKGVQVGIINFADPRKSVGIQIGVFNSFKSAYEGDGWFFPGINVCF